MTFNPVLETTKTETRTASVEYYFSERNTAFPDDLDTLRIRWDKATEPALDSSYSTPGGDFLKTYNDVITITAGTDTYIFDAEEAQVTPDGFIDFRGVLRSGQGLIQVAVWSAATDVEIVFDGPTTFSFRFGLPTTTIGPFRVCRPGESLRAVEVDFTFPNGLYTVNEKTGRLLVQWVDWEVVLTQVDGDGVPTGLAPIVWPLNYGDDNNTPQRLSFMYALPGGEWTAQARRITPEER